MRLNEYSILKGNAFVDVPLINEFWTSERVWRMFIYKYGKRKIACIADSFKLLTEDYFAVNDTVLRGIVNSQLGFITNEYSVNRSLQKTYGKIELREKDDTTTLTTTHGGTDTTTDNTTVNVTHGGTDTTTDNTTVNVTHGGTDTTTDNTTVDITHGGTDTTTEKVTTFDNTTDFKNKSEETLQHGETVSEEHGGTTALQHGETIAETHGGTTALQHGETIAETHGGTTALQHGETVSNVRGGDYSDTLTNSGTDTESETKTGYTRPPWLNAIEYNNNLIFALNKILELYANYILLKIY